MTTISQLSVKLFFDTQGFGAGVTDAQRQMAKLGTSMANLGRQMTMKVTLPIVAGFGLAIKEAMDFEGSLAKFNVVFKGMEDDMRAWVDTYRKEFPLATSEIVKHAAALQDLMVPMGINRNLAADMVKEWMDLAGALAAFNDVPIDQVLEAMKSGLAGMSRPLREYGIDVTETALKQHALTEGIWDGVSAWDAETRAVALLSKAYADSADAVNGLEEQKGSLRWQLEELKATASDFAGELGAVMLPVVKDWVESLTDVVKGLEGLEEEQLKQIINTGLMFAAVGPLLSILGNLALVINFAVIPAFKFLGAAGGPIFIAIAAIALLVDWVKKSEKAWENMLDVTEVVFDDMGNMINAETGKILSDYESFAYGMQGLNIEMFGKIYSTADSNMKATADAVKSYMGEIRRAVEYEASLAAAAMKTYMERIAGYARQMSADVRAAFSDVNATASNYKMPSTPMTFAGLFDSGGIVPGPKGAPQLAVVHGGETILPTHKTDAGMITINAVYNVSSKEMAEFANKDLVNKLQFRQLGVAFN